MFAFGARRPRRRPDLTPMIDVVFLLLVFFMLASRFSTETALPLVAATGTGGSWQGPPRLIEVGPAGEVMLNGIATPLAELGAALAPLTTGPDDPVVLRPRAAGVQDLVTVMDALRGAGFTRLIVVE